MKIPLHICVISPGFPYKNETEYIFVAQLVEAMADGGVCCSVIAPQSLSRQLIRKREKKPIRYQYNTKNGNEIKVYRPYTVSFSNLRIGRVSISDWLFSRAVCHVLRKMIKRPNVCYGHFWSSGYAIYPEAKRLELPLFVATGESIISMHKSKKDSQLRAFSKYVSGVICVSTKNKNESIDARLTAEPKCRVIPNAIDASKFYQANKAECRRKLGFPKDAFIVAFTGWFSERKGSRRVSDAITALDDPSVQSVFIGKIQAGAENCTPNCKGVLFCGEVPHDQMVSYLSCADVFVLPTLHEGCCNAIVEAMACGLPIVSSDRSFNDDILNEENSIRIDPNDVNSIANAIRVLKDDPEKCLKLGEKSLEIVQSFQIGRRAQEIISFLTRT